MAAGGGAGGKAAEAAGKKPLLTAAQLWKEKEERPLTDREHDELLNIQRVLMSTSHSGPVPLSDTQVRVLRHLSFVVTAAKPEGWWEVTFPFPSRMPLPPTPYD